MQHLNERKRITARLAFPINRTFHLVVVEPEQAHDDSQGVVLSGTIRQQCGDNCLKRQVGVSLARPTTVIPASEPIEVVLLAVAGELR